MNDLMAGYSGQKPPTRHKRNSIMGWAIGIGLVFTAAVAAMWFGGGARQLNTMLVETKPYKAWAVCEGTLGDVASDQEELIIAKTKYGYDREDDYEEAAKDIRSNWKEYFRREIFGKQNKKDIAGCCTCWMRAEEISWRLDPAFQFTSSSPPSRVVVIHYKASGIQLDRISAENKTVREINWSGDK